LSTGPFCSGFTSVRRQRRDQLAGSAAARPARCERAATRPHEESARQDLAADRYRAVVDDAERRSIVGAEERGQGTIEV
jgi:hypothetical protein